jgi:hypothetical protein
MLGIFPVLFDPGQLLFTGKFVVLEGFTFCFVVVVVVVVVVIFAIVITKG